MRGNRKKILIAVTLATITILSFSSNAEAACRRAYVCGDNGMNCRYQDVCNNTLDLPSVGINPLPSLPSTRLKPLPSVGLPPLGTSHCEYMQVNGQWQNVCQ